MEEKKKQKSKTETYIFGLGLILMFVFIILRLAYILTWHWVWITGPFWMSIVLVMVIALIKSLVHDVKLWIAARSKNGR